MSATSILTSKHTITALIVTPILAIIAYFGVDRMVSERPHKAEAGAVYKLAAMSKCRYQSGECTLKNGNFALTLRPEFRSEHVIKLRLESAFPLQGAKISIAPDSAVDYPPMEMEAESADGKVWLIRTSVPATEAPQLRVVATADGAQYFGQTGLEFTVYQTSFERDFRGGQQ